MKEIISKINKNELINDNDFRKIGITFCEDRGFLHLLRDIHFDDTYSNIGLYRSSNKELYFNFSKIHDLGENAAKDLQKIYNIPNNRLNLFINFEYLYVLYHELRHIEQDYTYDTSINCNQVFTYLYDVSVMAGSDQVLYDRFHDLFPIEIDANNYGFIYSYLTLLKSNISDNERKILLLQIYTSLLLHYKVENKKIISPVDQFNEKVGFIYLDHLIDLVRKYDVNSFHKFVYGLPINRYEYFKLSNKKTKTLKSINR